MNIGERIKQLREENSMTQTELAKKLGVATQTLYKYEKGIITNIPLDKLTKIAKALNVTPAYLMGWEASPTLSPDAEKLLADYNKLNTAGKEKASEYVADLTTISKYTETES